MPITRSVYIWNRCEFSWRRTIKKKFLKNSKNHFHWKVILVRVKNLKLFKFQELKKKQDYLQIGVLLPEGKTYVVKNYYWVHFLKAWLSPQMGTYSFIPTCVSWAFHLSPPQSTIELFYLCTGQPKFMWWNFLPMSRSSHSNMVNAQKISSLCSFDFPRAEVQIWKKSLRDIYLRLSYIALRIL